MLIAPQQQRRHRCHCKNVTGRARSCKCRLPYAGSREATAEGSGRDNSYNLGNGSNQLIVHSIATPQAWLQQLQLHIALGSTYPTQRHYRAPTPCCGSSSVSRPRALTSIIAVATRQPLGSQCQQPVKTTGLVDSSVHATTADIPATQCGRCTAV